MTVTNNVIVSERVLGHGLWEHPQRSGRQQHGDRRRQPHRTFRVHIDTGGRSCEPRGAEQLQPPASRTTSLRKSGCSTAIHRACRRLTITSRLVRRPAVKASCRGPARAIRSEEASERHRRQRQRWRSTLGPAGQFVSFNTTNDDLRPSSALPTSIAIGPGHSRLRASGLPCRPMTSPGRPALSNPPAGAYRLPQLTVR